jgi:hypothetical protein
VVTAAEKKDVNLSRRYAGQQVQPRQAMALWAGRGWKVSEEEGIKKTFHDLGISTSVGFLYTAATPAEIEGWTLEAVVFARVKDHKTGRHSAADVQRSHARHGPRCQRRPPRRRRSRSQRLHD